MDLLGTASLQPVVLIGAGTLGRALMSYRGFQKEGFEVVAAFDIAAKEKEAKNPTQPVYPMEHLVSVIKKRNVRLAVICVPPEEAQVVANDLVDAGGVGIMNFAPTVLQVPEDVMVNNVNLAIELENLRYFIQQ